MIRANLEYYRVFYHVVKCGSISAAAEQLCISQPAVSQAIHRLEQQLGGTLLRRSSRGVSVTPEGGVLYQHIERGYEQFIAGERRFDELLGLGAGELTIGASDMTLEFFLLDYLERFRNEYPDIKLKISNGPTPENMAQLKAHAVDFSLVSLPMDRDDAIELHELTEIRDCFVAGEKFAHLWDRPVSPSELTTVPLIMLESNTSTRRYVEGWLQQNGVDPVPEIELATSNLIVEFARRGLGVGCVVHFFAERALREGILREINLTPSPPARRLALATLKNAHLSPAAKRLIEMLI